MSKGLLNKPLWAISKAAEVVVSNPGNHRAIRGKLLSSFGSFFSKRRKGGFKTIQLQVMAEFFQDLLL